MYRLIFFQSKALKKDQKKLMKDKKALLHIQEALGRLAIDPFAGIQNVKKLIASEEATFRMRVGRWRISFDIDTVNKNIIIYRIKQRQEGYD